MRDPSPPPSPLPPRPAQAAVIPSSQLLDAEGKRYIEHKGERYLLRETRNGKLILTK